MVGRDTISSLAPALGLQQITKKRLSMAPPSVVHGGQYDTKYETFELLFHAAFVADTTWKSRLEPAVNRSSSSYSKSLPRYMLLYRTYYLSLRRCHVLERFALARYLVFFM